MQILRSLLIMDLLHDHILAFLTINLKHLPNINSYFLK